MASEYNNVQIVGNAGAAAEVRFFGSGKVLTQLRVAVYAGKDKPSHWFDVKHWAGNVDDEPVTKGTRVTVKGRLAQESWKDRTTGAERSKVVIVADSIDVTPWGDTGGSSTATPAQRVAAKVAKPQVVDYSAF